MLFLIIIFFIREKIGNLDWEANARVKKALNGLKIKNTT
jgi:hypothetical protein